MMTPERLAEIEHDHVEEFSHTWMAHSAHPTPCVVCELLTALREAQQLHNAQSHDLASAWARNTEDKAELITLQQRVWALEKVVRLLSRGGGMMEIQSGVIHKGDCDQALAQVALMDEMLRGAGVVLSPGPVEARALLDRLEKAEAVARAAEELINVHFYQGQGEGMRISALRKALAAYRSQ